MRAWRARRQLQRSQLDPKRLGPRDLTGLGSTRASRFSSRRAAESRAHSRLRHLLAVFPLDLAAAFPHQVAVAISRISFFTWSKASTYRRTSGRHPARPARRWPTTAGVDLAEDIVAEETHRAGGKRRQPRQSRRSVPAARASARRRCRLEAAPVCRLLDVIAMPRTRSSCMAQSDDV